MLRNLPEEKEKKFTVSVSERFEELTISLWNLVEISKVIWERLQSLVGWDTGYYGKSTVAFGRLETGLFTALFQTVLV